MEKLALVVTFEGFEDIEAVSIIDVLRRANLRVVIASATLNPLRGAWGSLLTPDIALAEIDHLADAIILPGGLRNAESLAKSPLVKNLLKEHYQAGKLVAAICASPSMVLGEAADLLKERQATGDPAMQSRLAATGALVNNQDVVVDGQLVTSKGPRTAIPFALTIADLLGKSSRAKELADYWEVKFK